MPQNNKRAGALRELLEFQKRGDGVGDWGQPIPGTGDWEEVFTTHGSLTPRVGGETVTAARLNGEQPYVLTIRQTSQTADITSAWRIVDARAGSNSEGKPNRVFAIKAPPTDPDGKNAWLEILISENAAS